MHYAVRTSQGFSLIELITVIIVLGIVSIGVSGFLRSGVQIYKVATERDQLLSESRFVVERLNRELRGAIPNSVREIHDTNAGSQCIEFVPANWVTYYTRLPEASAADNIARIVGFANNEAGFNWQAGDFAFVYPTSNQDIYADSSEQRRTISACTVDGKDECNSSTSVNNIASLTLNDSFNHSSPASRLYIGLLSVSYCAINNRLYRYEGNIAENQSLYSAGQGVLMAKHLANDLSDVNDLPFQLSAATLNRNSVVQIQLNFVLNEEMIEYTIEVHVPNVP